MVKIKMHERKIWKQGHDTWVVTLDKKRLMKRGVKLGDEIDITIEVEDNGNN